MILYWPKVLLLNLLYIFKNIHKIVFSSWNAKVSGVYNFSAQSKWLSTFLFSVKKTNIRGAVIAKNVNQTATVFFA